MLADVRLIGADRATLRDAAVPFSGRWHARPAAAEPVMIAVRFVEAGYPDEAVRLLSRYLADAPPDGGHVSAERRAASHDV